MRSRKKKRKKETPSPSLQPLRASPRLPDLPLLSSSPLPCSVFSLTFCSYRRLAAHFRCRDQPFGSSLDVHQHHCRFTFPFIDTFGEEFQDSVSFLTPCTPNLDPLLVGLGLANSKYWVGKSNCNKALSTPETWASVSERPCPSETVLDVAVVNPFLSRAMNNASCTRIDLTNPLLAVSSSRWDCVSTKLHRQIYTYGPQVSRLHLCYLVYLPMASGVMLDALCLVCGASFPLLLLIATYWTVLLVIKPPSLSAPSQSGVWICLATISSFDAVYWLSAFLVILGQGFLQSTLCTLLGLTSPFQVWCRQRRMARSTYFSITCPWGQPGTFLF